MATVNLHINFGTGLGNYADYDDEPHIKDYLLHRGWHTSNVDALDADSIIGAYEEEVCTQIAETAQRVISQAHPYMDITVEWVTFRTAWLPWKQDRIDPPNDDLLKELMEELSDTVESVMNHTYGTIG